MITISFVILYKYTILVLHVKFFECIFIWETCFVNCFTVKCILNLDKDQRSDWQKVNRVAVFNLYLMAVLLLWYLMLVVSCICRINALRRSLLYFLFITSWGVHYTTSNPLVSIYISIRFIFWNIWAPLILVYNAYFIMWITLIENVEYTCYLKYIFIHSGKHKVWLDKKPILVLYQGKLSYTLITCFVR